MRDEQLNLNLLQLALQIENLSREIKALKQEANNLRLGIHDDIDFVKIKCEDDAREEAANDQFISRDIADWNC